MGEKASKLFLKKGEDPREPGVRSRMGKLSGLVGLGTNLLLCAGKIAVGMMSGSVSVTADGVNNLTDAAGSAVTLIGFRLSEIPPDENHPFGHARFEYLSGLAVAAIILVIGTQLLESSVKKIFHPEPVVFSGVLVGVMVVSMAVKLWLAAFHRKLGKKIQSAALLAAGADSRNDVLATGAVLLAAAVEHLTHFRIDGYVGLGAALIILYSGIQLGKDTVNPLLGAPVSPELRKKITDMLEQEPLILGYHDLMIHDYGPGQRFGTIHVEMDHTRDSIDCHEIIDTMERRCFRELNVHLVIHFDPVIVGDGEQDALRKLISQSLSMVDERLHLHDFRMLRTPAGCRLRFDVELPRDMSRQKAEIQDRIVKSLSRVNPNKYQVEITFDPAEKQEN